MENIVRLPNPKRTGKLTLEEVLWERRSVRTFKDTLLTMIEVSQLLWATQGVRNSKGYRTAPSAGALYPKEHSLYIFP